MTAPVLNFESIDFLLNARKETNEIAQLEELLNSPREFSRKNAIEMSENVESEINELKSINENKDFSRDDPINEEAISFLNKVIIDGRYLKKWTTEPEIVADELNISVSEDAIDRIKSMNIETIIDPEIISNPNEIKQEASAVGIGIVIVIVLVFIPSTTAYNINDIVVDPNSKETLK